MDEPRRPTTLPAAAAGGPSVDPCREARASWCSEQLFGPLQEIRIRHGDAVYRLRKTALGKLILTK